MTLEEAQAWVAPKEMTEAEVAFVHLLVAGTINGNEHVLYGRCYLEVEDVLLTQPIPDSFQELRWGGIKPEPVILTEFLLLKPEKIEGGTTSMITLCSKDWAGSMQLPMPAWRIGAWVQAVEPFGYTLVNFLDQAGKDARMPEGEA
jgi:hypothetical protein